MNATETQSGSSLDPLGSVIWVVACILRRRDGITDTLAQTISWMGECTENEARGRAAAYALESKPGFAIELMTVAKIELSSPNVAGEQPGEQPKTRV